MTCRSCGATIVWRELAGRQHPYNPDGTSHFMTCPDAESWRDGQKSEQQELFS